MANITITDKTALTANVSVRDDSPFARARGTQMVLAAASLVGDFNSPVDQINFSTGTFGASFAEPSLLLSGPATLAVNASASGALSVVRFADLTLFPDDGASPAISIAADECWIGVEIDGTLGEYGIRVVRRVWSGRGRFRGFSFIHLYVGESKDWLFPSPQGLHSDGARKLFGGCERCGDTESESRHSELYRHRRIGQLHWFVLAAGERQCAGVGESSLQLQDCNQSGRSRRNLRNDSCVG